MNIMTLIIAVLACCGLVWSYPRLPAPGGLILVIIVAVACVAVLLNLGGVSVLHF
jgi:hypothetical protein